MPEGTGQSVTLLSYEPSPRRRWYRRRRVRVAGSAILLIALIAALAVFGPRTWRSAMLAYHAAQTRAAFDACRRLDLAAEAPDTPLFADTDDVAPRPLLAHYVGEAIAARYEARRSPPSTTTSTAARSDAKPRIAAEPAAVTSLRHHVTQAATLDPSGLRFAPAFPALRADEAFLFVGQTSAPERNTEIIDCVVVGPDELRVDTLAIRASEPGQDVRYALFSPGSARVRVSIARRSADDRFEWLAARHVQGEQAGQRGHFIARYRLNGESGELHLPLPPPSDLPPGRPTATHGLITWRYSDGRELIWFVGASSSGLVDGDRDAKWIEYRSGQIAFFRRDADDELIVAEQKAYDDSGEMRLSRVGRDGQSAPLSTIKPPDRTKGQQSGPWAISDDASRMLLGVDTTGYLYDLPSGKLRATVDLPQPDHGDACAAAFDTDGRTLVVYGPRGETIRWFDLSAADGASVRSLTPVARQDFSPAPFLGGRAVMRGGRTFASRNEDTDSAVCFARPGATSQPIVRRERERNVLLNIDPTGTRRALFVDDLAPNIPRLSVIDIDTGMTIHEIVELGEHVFGHAWSADGRHLAMGTSDYVLILDLQTGTCRRLTKPALGSSTPLLSISRDGRHLALGDAYIRDRFWTATLQNDGKSN